MSKKKQNYNPLLCCLKKKVNYFNSFVSQFFFNKWPNCNILKIIKNIEILYKSIQQKNCTFLKSSNKKFVIRKKNTSLSFYFLLYTSFQKQPRIPPPDTQIVSILHWESIIIITAISMVISSI